jgi:hypothetical protein
LTRAGLAHIVFTGSESLVFEVVNNFRSLQRHSKFISLGLLSEKARAIFLHLYFRWFPIVSVRHWW